MADDRKFILGRGERLTEEVDTRGGFGEKAHPYTFSEARSFLAPQIAAVAANLRALPERACPRDEAVAIVTLHPSYIARSYFPNELLGAVGLRAVGSRSVALKPRKYVGKKKEGLLETTELYVAGKRRYIERWAETLPQWRVDNPGAEQLQFVERVLEDSLEYRTRPIEEEATVHLEVVLHASAEEEYIVDAFRRYVRDFDCTVLHDRRHFVGGLCYLPVSGASSATRELAAFSYLRVVRPMPQMRPLSPFRGTNKTYHVKLPNADALNQHLRVAVLDGGLPDDPDISRWATHVEPNGIGPATAGALGHGLAVTSAVLHGAIDPSVALPVPYVNVDHHRVVDINAQWPDYYDILDRVTEVLKSSHYDYVNISVGPDLTLDDVALHLWTVKLDEIFAHGKTLATIAVGNRGHHRSPNSNRIGAPSDAVNAMGVGAADSRHDPWKRADYSSRGPGRPTGVVKPDVVAYGGCVGNEFTMLAPGAPTGTREDCGTSFSAPLALRTGLGIAAFFGYGIRPLAVKALLISNARKGSHHINEVGWGRISDDYLDVVTCSGSDVQIVYQGILRPGKSLRAEVPLPSKLSGRSRVRISATICYGCEIEPQNPATYTRAGLEVVFRPHAQRRKEPSQLNADSATFFQAADFKETETRLRTDAHKWETTLKKERTFTPDQLHEPVFDIHYVAREGGSKPSTPAEIPYAMVVRVEQADMATLYDDVVARYRSRLEILRPQVSIPIRVYSRQP